MNITQFHYRLFSLYNYFKCRAGKLRFFRKLYLSINEKNRNAYTHSEDKYFYCILQTENRTMDIVLLTSKEVSTTEKVTARRFYVPGFLYNRWVGLQRCKIKKSNTAIGFQFFINLFHPLKILIEQYTYLFGMIL